jgi:hypothetical protein
MKHIYSLVKHRFGQKDTVYGAIKRYNSHEMTQEEVEVCTIYYVIENKTNIQRAGEEVLVPVLKKYENVSRV